MNNTLFILNWVVISHRHYHNSMISLIIGFVLVILFFGWMFWETEILKNIFYDLKKKIKK